GRSISVAPRLDFEDLLAEVGRVFGVEGAEIVGRSRARPALRARQAAALIARERLDLSLPEIGAKLGGRDHSTVHNALRKAEELALSDPDFSARLNRLRASINAGSK